MIFSVNARESPTERSFLTITNFNITLRNITIKSNNALFKKKVSVFGKKTKLNSMKNNHFHNTTTRHARTPSIHCLKDNNKTTSRSKYSNTSQLRAINNSTLSYTHCLKDNNKTTSRVDQHKYNKNEKQRIFNQNNNPL
jgi:hypothetical protein